MTSEQGQPDQPPEGEKPKKSRRTSGTRRAPSPQPEARRQPRASEGQTQKGQKGQEPVQQGQPASSESDLSQLLELQISDAIQPVLADFRQQMAQAVQQEMQHALATDGMGAPPSGQSKATGVPPPAVQQTVQRGSGESQPEAGEEDKGVPGTLSRRLGSVSAAMLRGLEEQGEQWLQSLLLAGLTALFAESARAAVQQQAEKGLQTLVQRTFDALPDSPTKQELQLQTERTLQAILREVLDAIFAADVRTELQSHGQRATQALTHRNVEEALAHVRQALQAVLQEILAVLRRQWQRVLRLLLKVILTALEDSLSSAEKERLPSTSAERGEEQVARSS